MKILVTGGAGFIGSAVVRHIINHSQDSVLNLDKLTYAGHLSTVATVSNNSRYQFQQGDICDRSLVMKVFQEYQPDAVMHLAAESHVDRSIDNANDFIQTNIVGTYTLLDIARQYWSTLDNKTRETFRFHHISTDEVFGDLGETGGLFTEQSPYEPSSPYSASKAGSDHLVRAWHRTYGLPTLITNCSNNYGPYHYPEKLIPLIILKGLAGNPMPVYGKGDQIRDWLYVEDHARALHLIVHKGKPGQTYNVGGLNEKTNIEVVRLICQHLEQQATDKKPSNIQHYEELITFVQDRPGHDLRYAIDASKLTSELHWQPQETFESGLQKTVAWYLSHLDWVAEVQSGTYSGERLGVKNT